MPISSENTREADQAAEALLLLRLALNDGEASKKTMAVVRRVGWRAYGIDAMSMDRLEASIAAYGSESARAGAQFRARPQAERLRLANTLLTVASHDEALKTHGVRLRGRLAALLDLNETALQ